MDFTPTVRRGYENLWNAAKVLPQHAAAVNELASKLLSHRARYEAVEKETGVPWWWIAIVHERESDCDFSTHLANGDPLDHKTVHVPAGRGPFATWEEGAVDALRYMGLDKITDWSLPSALYQFERYNGWGYLGKVNSPYVWSWTDQYGHGKYTADGVYSSSAIDQQPGAVAMLKGLIMLIPNLIVGVASAATAPATSAVKNVPSSGVTISTAQNLATHLLAAVGAIIAASGIPALHSVYDILTSSSFLGGTIVSVLAAAISQINVIGANDNTLKILDKIIVDITPHASLAQQVAATDPNSAPQA